MQEPSDLAFHLLYKLHLESKRLSPWELICLQDKTLNEFSVAWEEIIKNEWIELDKENKGALTEKGKEKVTSKLVKESEPYNYVCVQCEARGYFVEQDSTLLNTFKKCIEKRPPPNEEYDQTAISAEDAIVRVSFFHQRGDLLDKDILMIGDFDCLSLVAALTRLPKRVHVFEVDERLCKFLNDCATEFNLNLSATSWDVRSPLPQEYQKQFDVFSCDPVETYEGIKLYLSRGTQGLRGIGSCTYIGLTTLEAGRKKWYDIQTMLMEMNFVLTDVRRNFNGYPNTGLEDNYVIAEKLGSEPDCIWYWAALVRGECVDVPNPLVKGEYTNDADIYMDDEAWATTTYNLGAGSVKQ